jgi:hypothetical protein
MLPLLSIGVNGKSPTGKKSARECCIMLANKITPSVFTESVNSTDLSDLQKEELISIACPAPVEVVEVEEVKKEESYFDRRKRELEAEEEEMDIFVKKFLGRLGYSDDSIAKVEKIGVRCFSDLNDLAIQDDAIDLMEQAGLKKIEARKLLGEMSKRIAEEKQRKLEQKAKEDQIAAEKARLLKEKLHEEKIAQIAEEKKKKREEAEALALENKFKKEKEKEAEEERLNQIKAKQLEEWETEKNKRQALIEKGDVIEGPIEVPVKGRMGLITHKPRYAIFDTTSCILKIYEEGEYTVLSEHFVVAGLAVQKGRVGLRNKKYRVDVPLMTIENSLKIKSQLVCSTLFTLFVVQNCESFIPHESIAQYHFNTSEEAEKWCFVWNGNDEGNKIVNERLETEKEKAKELQKIKEEEDKIRKEELKKEKDLKKLKKDLQLKEKKELEKKEKDQKSSSSSSTSRQPKDGEAPKENPTSNTEGTSTATSPSAAVNKDGVEVPTTEVPKTSTETGNEEESALEADSQSVASASTKSPKSKGSRLSLTKAMSSVTKGIKSPKLSTSSSRKSIFK